MTTTTTDRRPIARLTADGNRIEFDSPYSVENLARVKSVGGYKWEPDKKVFSYPATPAIAWALRNAWREHGGFQADKAVVALVQAGREQADRQEQAQAAKSDTGLADPGHMNFPLWMHQRQGFYFAKELTAAGLFFDMGVGKTLTSIALLDDWKVSSVLIECPLSVATVWAGTPNRAGEFEKHSKRDWLVVNASVGSAAQRVHRMDQAWTQAAQEKRPLAIVANYDAARTEPLAGYLTSKRYDALVLDESHRLKDPGGVTSKHAQAVGKRAGRKLLLTGTPMPHNPTDIYAQYRAVAPEVFGTNFAKFRSRYCIMGGWMGKEIVGFQNQEELNRKMYSIAIRVGKEVLDLPEYHHIWREFTLGKKAQKVYAELAADFVSEVVEGKITAANALVRLLRLAQVTSGYAPADSLGEGDERTWVRIDDGKARLLEETLGDLPADEPVVIFCRFWRDLDIVHEAAAKLERGSLELSGRRHELDQWQADEGTNAYPILAVQEQSGGVGIDLTRARFQIFYSKGFSLGLHDQALARTHRPGQTRSVVYIHLRAAGTVDEYVDQILQERRDVVEGILDMAKRGMQLSLQGEAMKDALAFAGF